MKKFNYEKVESAIGYHFNNKRLLKQAFFRSSFAHENGRESNEVLEFVGDKVLDIAVIRILLEKYAKSNNGEEFFKSSKQEGDLTKIKSSLVSTGYLADSFNDLDVEEFIYYGKSDLNNNATDVTSVKEDVFEAIIGAIALDSNWDIDKIIKIVKRLLHTDRMLKQADADTNYVGQLQELASAYGLPAPMYSLESLSKNNSMIWRATCKIKGIGATKEGVGFKQKDAKKDAAKQMLHLVRMYIHTGKINSRLETDVFAQINFYVQAGNIDKPKYEFEEYYDENGNPYWECTASIHELGYVYFGQGSSKKEAQKHALAEALNDLN